MYVGHLKGWWHRAGMFWENVGREKLMGVGHTFHLSMQLWGFLWNFPPSPPPCTPTFYAYGNLVTKDLHTTLPNHYFLCSKYFTKVIYIQIYDLFNKNVLLFPSSISFENVLYKKNVFHFDPINIWIPQLNKYSSRFLYIFPSNEKYILYIWWVQNEQWKKFFLFES